MARYGPTKERCRIRICQFLRDAFLVTSDQTPRQAKERLIDLAAVIIPSQYASLWRFNKRTNTLHLGAAKAEPELFAEAILPLDTPAGDAITQDTGYVYVPDVSKEPRYRDTELIRRFGLRHMYSFRFGKRRQDGGYEPEGIVCIYPMGEEPLEEEEVQDFSNAIEIAALPVQLSVDALRLRIVEEVNALALGALDRNSYLHKVVSIVSRHIALQVMTIFLWDERNDVFLLGAEIPESFGKRVNRDEIRYRSFDPHYSTICRGEAVFVHAGEAARIYKDTVCREVICDEYYTLALVPIVDCVDPTRVLGFVRFANELNRIRTADKDYFSENDFAIFGKCVEAISVALHYYQEREKLHTVFSHFQHEASNAVEEIEAKLERLEHPDKFKGEDESRRQFHYRDIGRARAVLQELLLQYSEIGVTKYAIEVPDDPISMLEAVVVPCVNTGRFHLNRLKLPHWRRPGLSTIHYDKEGLISMPRLYVDDRRMRQVFANLIGNAVKYHSADKEDFEIEIRVKEFPASYGVLVCDTGMGVRPAIESKIFDLDYRSPEARRRNVFGTGLGLYLCKQYVEQHGGEIKIIQPDKFSGFGIPMHFKTGLLVTIPKVAERREEYVRYLHNR